MIPRLTSIWVNFPSTSPPFGFGRILKRFSHPKMWIFSGHVGKPLAPTKNTHFFGCLGWTNSVFFFRLKKWIQCQGPRNQISFFTQIPLIPQKHLQLRSGSLEKNNGLAPKNHQENHLNKPTNPPLFGFQPFIFSRAFFTCKQKMLLQLGGKKYQMCPASKLPS